ncbi:MAG: endonuclease/exonuclease/phosphatase family protein [Leptolyngbyaceae cyanobacterium RM1_1_2]|nr:endonuclease/exonuclease/phosphatase family protein [Leptolyngbyaceae cyanobacterium RM1_1_2]
MVSSKSQQLGLSALVAGLLLAAIAAITLFGLLTSRYGWKIYLEVFSHFQLQYCVICVVLLVLLGLTRRRLMSLLGLFCCSALLATQILPWYFPPVWLSPRPQSDLRVLIANVNTQNQQFEQVLALTRQVQPDLALFMEVNDVWVSQLNTLQDILPFSSAEASPYNFGIALYSRLALDSPEIVQFSPDSTASITAAIEVAGRSLSLVAAHPCLQPSPAFFRPATSS